MSDSRRNYRSGMVSDDNLFERLHDLSIGTGSRTPLAAIKRIEELEAKLEKSEPHWQSSQRIGEAMYRLHKLKYWLDMDQELFDGMTDEQQADHKYVQTAVDGIIWALKGTNQ